MSLSLLPPDPHAREKWVKLLLKELEHCAELGLVDPAHLGGLRTMRGHKGTWRWQSGPDYDYRTILPNEIVFDIGDHCETWGEVVEQSEALWDELDEMVKDGEYLACLSGGKGTHTHLFLEDPTDGMLWDYKSFPDHDLRTKIANWMTFRRRVKATRGGSRVFPDPVCIAPNHGSRQLREFGSVKKRAKTLFFVGPLHRKPLPYDIGEAYFSVGLKYPSSVLRCRSVDGLSQARLTRTFGTTCPRSAACVLDRTGCDSCPF